MIGLNTGDVSLYEKNKQVLLVLLNIQKAINGDESIFTFSLYNFLELCSFVQISDLSYIQRHIMDTIGKLEMKMKENIGFHKLLIKYGNLYALSFLFKKIAMPSSPIKREHSFLTLRNQELRNNKSILSEILKFDLLKELLNEHIFSEESSILLGNQDYIEIISILSMIATNFKKELIVDLLKKIQNNNKLMNFVYKLFPYKNFKEGPYSMISYWITILKQLIEKEIYFSFTIDQQTIEFNTSSSNNFTVHLQMNDQDNFEVTAAQLLNNDQNIDIEEQNKEEKIKMNLTLYDVILKFSNNMKELKDPNYIKKTIKKSKKNFENGKIKNSSINSIMSLRDIFDFHIQENSLISLIWNIVYTLHENESNDLSQIIHPIESDLLTSAYSMLQDIDQVTINDIVIWSKWASLFENNAKILWNIDSIIQKVKNQEEIDLMIGNINEVIKYLGNYPEQINIYWSSNKYIEICQNLLLILSEKKSQKVKDERAAIIKKRIGQLKKDLINQKVKNKFKHMQTELVNKLSEIRDYTDDVYEQAKKKVDQFLIGVAKYSEESNDLGIIWPHPNYEDLDDDSVPENIKLFESLIRYSQIKSILNEINNNKDVIINLWKLDNFKEMRCPKDIFFDYTIKNQSSLTIKDKNQGLFTLNASMILVLYKINRTFLKDHEKIPKIINQYIERNSIDEREVRLMYHILLNYSQDIKLLIPKFEPNDLVFLLVNKIGHSTYQAGPLIHRTKNTAYLKDLKKLMHEEFSSFTEAATKIGKITFKSLLSSDGDTPNKYEDLKKAFIDYKKDQDPDYDILKKIHYIFEFAEYLDKWEYKAFKFDDISFLSNDWINDNNLLNNYPSLYYWMIRNREFSDQLISMYHGFKPNDSEIPLWILALRIFSSINCISFEYNSTPTYISEIIDKTVSNSIIKYLFKKKGEGINHDWMNILISNLPLKFANSSLSVIHDFFTNLSMDNYSIFSEKINEGKNKCIMKAIKKVTEQMLNNESQNLLTENINNRNSLVYFLAFPSKYILKEINGDLLEGINFIFKNKDFLDLYEYLNKYSLSNIIKELKDAIDIDENEIKNYFINQNKKEYDARKQDKIKEIKNYVTKYKEKYEKLKSMQIKKSNKSLIFHGKKNVIKDQYPSIESYQRIIEDLVSTQLKLRDINGLFAKNEIIVFGLHYLSDKNLTITIREGDFSFIQTTLPKSVNERDYFLFPGQYYQKNDNFFYKNLIKPSEYKFKSINDYFNYDRITIDVINVNHAPKIYFGKSNLDSSEFIENINNLNSNLNSFKKQFSDFKRNRNNFNLDFFNCIIKIDKCISEISRNIEPKFQAQIKVEKTTRVIQDKLSQYIIYVKDLINKIKKIINECQHQWETMRIFKNGNSEVFGFQYDIQIPSVHEYYYKFDFSSIQNIGSLASPIISITPDNNIICSVKKIKCSIGPIIYSYISNPYSINIISFINEEVSCRIDNLNDQQYSKIITTKEKLNPNETIQILITPTFNSLEEPKIINIMGDIIINSKSSQPYSLPFEIRLGIVPLKIRLKCFNYKLAIIDKGLKLCCNRIFSGNTLKFETSNYYDRSNYIVTVETESLEENEASRPEINKNKSLQYFSLKIPEVQEPTRSQFRIKVALSQKIVIQIQCDFIIMPFTFSFEIYDYMKREYTSDCNLIYIPNFKHKLYFRIMTFLPCEQKCNIEMNIPRCVSIKSEKKEFSKEGFTINGDYFITSDIKYEDYVIKTYPTRYDISIKIGGIKKKIDLTFNYLSNFQFIPFKKSFGPNDVFINAFPCEEYNYKMKKWTKIDNANKLSKTPNFPYFICTPFKLYTNMKEFPKINYDNKKVSYSGSQEIVYLQMSFAKNDDNLIHKSKSRSKSSYVIIEYPKDNEDLWFPAFDTYPNLGDIKFIPYTIDEKNIKKARNNIRIMYKDIEKKIEIDKIDSYIQAKKIPIRKTNFAVLMILLSQDAVNNHLKSFIGYFPQEIQVEFGSLISDIDSIINEGVKIDELSDIITHNLILKFAQILNKKYLDIKSHQFCLENRFSQDELQNKVSQLNNQLFTYNKDLDHIRSLTTNREFNKIEKAFASIEVEPLPELSEQYNSIMISEKDPPKPSQSETLGKFNFIDVDNDTLISNDVDSLKSLPDIKLPKVLTIESLNTFYSQCSQGSTALPTYIRICHVESKSQKESETYFSKLLYIYDEITKYSPKNYSILSKNVNSFIESFQNCVKRLKKAGIDFSKVALPQSLKDNDDNFQDFIKYPDVDYPKLPKGKWNIKNQSPLNATKFHDKFNNNGKFGIHNIFKDDLIEDSLNNNDTVQNEVIVGETGDNFERNIEDEQLLIAQIIDDQNIENESESMKDDSDNEKENEALQKKPTLKITNKSKKETVVVKDIRDISTEFTEYDSIERVLKRIKEMNKDGKLKFLDSTECIIQNQNELFKSSATNFPVQKLVEHSQYLIANLIAKASDVKCPFLDISCNLLIDCSSFICKQNKLYNFMILVSFSYALSVLEIPFSIAIVADKKFRFVLKPFEEDISTLVLQRVFDCLFIKRYKTNIADTIRHAIEFMKCPDEKRTQRALFFFSDGLDENLVLAQSWKETLLNDSNNSFGLIFIKSKFLDEKKYSNIQKMWDSFIEVAKTASSITKLIYINPDINDSTFETIISTFYSVLSRSQFKSNYDFKNKTDYKPEFKQASDDLSNEIFDIIKSETNFVFDVESSSIYKKINQRFIANGSRFPKLDVGHYRNLTEKMTISNPSHSIKDEFDQFIHQIVYSKRNIFRPLLETIFKPNKASQTVLSSTGVDFDITALILNLINPVPDPLIYLEEKGGLIRNYGVSIIIDSSKSCFNQLFSSHSYQTIKILLTALASIDIPCIDIIIATDEAPIILASEISSVRLLNDKSPFWPSLFDTLANASYDKCALEDAIHAAYDIRRMRSVDSTSYMFILTDGLFQEEQREIIQNHIMTCFQSGITIFGIGIGIYPCGIVELFPQVIYATNPNDLIKAVASCFVDELNELYDKKIKQLAPEPCSADDISNTFEKLIQNEEKPIFKDLKNYLSETIHALDAFTDMYNEEQVQTNSNNEFINPEGLNTEMYISDILKGQKILIVMLYSYLVNLAESHLISPEYLSKAEYAGDGECVKKAVEHFGIEIVVVTNYKDAINELISQKGKCKYYAVWVISGLPYDMKLFDGGNQYLIDQFIDCLLQFWNNGGSVVLFAESEPLTFQANRFLEKVIFPDGNKTKLRLKGNHFGQTYLRGDPKGKLDQPGKFNKSPLQFQKMQRASLSHNIVKIYEGETISYAQNDPEILKPFIPFMKDSENGISALFYPGDRDLKHITGDIIIDCGYTKLFSQMTTEGTFRYVQNIAGWTAQIETKRILGINPKDFRPKAVIFKLNENVKVSLPKRPGSVTDNVKNHIKNHRLFAIDLSGSVKNVEVYHKKVQGIFEKNYKNGDTIIIWNHEAQIIDYETMNQYYSSMHGNGGTDPCTIVDELIQNKDIPREHLILVTDGQISSELVKKCDQIIQSNNISFKYVTTYIIGRGGNTSISAAFERNCSSIIIPINDSGEEIKELIIMTDESDFLVLDEIDSIKSISSFKEKYKSLMHATVQKMKGTEGDYELKTKYTNLYERFRKRGFLDQDHSVKAKIEILIKAASGGLQDTFDLREITAMINQ
ncbi:hypothetical protein M9Y10_000702 [Tritrichomonas musculus]|uniref:HECT domain-containing protein n=1 Tax=Tritrichomonas musculus TaxID=1915356 RepID=A0ABR2L827_9EUKA